MTINNENENDRESDSDHKDWRKLCELVARERDPRRLSALLDQLIKKLDARRRELRNNDQQASESNRNND